MVTGISGVSGLTGGNCTREEAEAYRRELADIEGWDGSVPTKPETGFSDWVVLHARQVHAAHAERARRFLRLSDAPYPDDWRVAAAAPVVLGTEGRRRALTGIVKTRVEKRDLRRELVNGYQREASHAQS